MNLGMDMPSPPSGGTEQHSRSGMMAMKMTFYWGKRADLMFPGWSSHTIAQYLLSLAALFVLAFFHQALTHMRTLVFEPNQGKNSSHKDFATKSVVIETAAFAVNAATGYILMLAVMSYNAGVFVVILAGLSVGFFVFRSWKTFGSAPAAAAETSQRPVHQTEGAAAA